MRSFKSSRKLRAGVVGIAMALTASACGTSTTTEATATPDAAVGDEAATGLPQLVGTTVSGTQLDTNDLADQDIVVWFWAPW